LRNSDVDKLCAFFARNNRAEITHYFRPFPLTEETAKDLLKPDREDLFFILEENDIFLAFSMLRGKDEGFDIPGFGIFVDWERQHYGYGNRLSAWTFNWADQENIPKIRLSVYEDNLNALSLYKRYGFLESERRKDKQGRVSLIMYRTMRKVKTKIFASTQTLVSSDILSQRLEKWSDAGIHNIELSNYKIEDESEFFSAASRHYGKLLIHHFFPSGDADVVLNLASPDSKVRQNTNHFFQRSIEWSAKIGAPFFSFHAGYITDPVGRDNNGFILANPLKNEYEKAWERYTTEVKSLAKYAAARGIKLLIENNVVTMANKDKLLLSKPNEFERFIKQFSKTDNVGILFDWGHWHVTAQTYGLDIDSFLLVADSICGVHLHSNNGLDDQHLPFMVDDFKSSMLRKISPKYITLEGRYSTLSDVQQNMLEMEEYLNERTNT